MLHSIPVFVRRRRRFSKISGSLKIIRQILVPLLSLARLHGTSEISFGILLDFDDRITEGRINLTVRCHIFESPKIIHFPARNLA